MMESECVENTGAVWSGGYNVVLKHSCLSCQGDLCRHNTCYIKFIVTLHACVGIVARGLLIELHSGPLAWLMVYSEYFLSSLYLCCKCCLAYNREARGKDRQPLWCFIFRGSGSQTAAN